MPSRSGGESASEVSHWCRMSNVVVWETMDALLSCISSISRANARRGKIPGKEQWGHDE